MPALLYCQSNFSFLTGASHPEDLVHQAATLGYHSIAITDECSLAGVVKAHTQAKVDNINLIIGSYFHLAEHCQLVVYAPTKQAYTELSGLISLARRRSPKGEYHIELNDLQFRLKTCLLVWQPTAKVNNNPWLAQKLSKMFMGRLWLGVSHSFLPGEQRAFAEFYELSKKFSIPMIANDHIVMAGRSCQTLQDTVTAIRLGCTVQQLGDRAQINAEKYIKPLDVLLKRYPSELLANTDEFCGQFTFSLDELRYQYPKELVPDGLKPIDYLRQLTEVGAKIRWPEGVSAKVNALIEHELSLVQDMEYEYYFLTVEDIVRFAKENGILCQGRGSAANSVICYCLGITEVSPDLINVLFERFISKERDEPPDIDVDFEHQRREEVIQYIYQKYGRERAALTATVITYRARSAVRDVGKALGFDEGLLDHLSKNIAWWEKTKQLKTRFQEYGFNISDHLLQRFYQLIHQIIGFPRHLSQHVGGFVISEGKISELVPIENAAMDDRTVIQWDKTDIEALGLLKVDVLALGMLSALRRGIELVHSYNPAMTSLQDIPREDPATYQMLSNADSVGVFQVESRAQMAMLPRLKPRCFYDLVIEIAIVRPGPIQGDMVHPFLRRRDGHEPVTYPSDAIKHVLEPTLGVPIFQEQAIRIAMVAAGFSGGEADQLRRAMAAWGRNGNLLGFKEKLINGMLARGYDIDFAERMFEQLKGFGGYGFPESHSASFAILCYLSSWLKCHHPAAFYTALLNSQPMGFYSPAQLVQDAIRHGIQVKPPDIVNSQWESTIEEAPINHLGVIRLGFNRIKGFKPEVAEKITAVRSKQKSNEPQDIKSIAYAAGLSRSDLDLLASSDALAQLSGNRHQAHWQVSGIEEQKPLFNNSSMNSDPINSDSIYSTPEHSAIKLPEPQEQHQVFQDYEHTGLSLRRHPMEILRTRHPFSRCKTQRDLAHIHHGGFVRIAGLVTGRQRPSTAKGVLFLTLEDETGNANIVVWKSVQDRFRSALLTSKLLIVKGTVETDNRVIHVIAGHLLDASDELAGFAMKSRDFH